MVRSTARKSIETARQILDRIKLSQQVRRQDYFLLTSVILADTSLSHAERQQINRLFDEVQTGHLQLVD
jgi:hypothetical protein